VRRGVVLLLLAALLAPAPADAAPDWPSSKLELGLSDSPGGAAALKRNARVRFRYQYLAAGVNTGNGWATWNPDGTFASLYVEESRRAGLTPVFTYYMLQQSRPGANGEADTILVNLRNTATMRALYEDLILFFERARAAGGSVILHVEPDLWGYVQQAAAGDDASTIPARVAATGIDELTGLPDNVAGFGQAIVRLRDAHAPNVVLGYHVSVWGTGTDIALQDPPSREVDALARRSAAFYASLRAPFDVTFAEFDDRDSGFNEHVNGDRGASRWRRGDYARDVRFTRGYHRATGQQIVKWQIPLGNTLMRAMNNTWGHYQDNRVQTLIGGRTTWLRRYREAGVIALLFGRGAEGTTCACDARRDGVTNPSPINGNRRRSLSADDDGGYFKNRSRAYARKRLRLPR
jgi:hypothetical protein